MSLPSQIFLSVTNSIFFYFYYICNYTTYVTLNDAVVAHLFKRLLQHWESKSTTRFKNRSSDRMPTSDWLVDVSDDQCTTNYYDDRKILMQKTKDIVVKINFVQKLNPLSCENSKCLYFLLYIQFLFIAKHSGF
jgi:hypothetical protein